MRITFEGDAMFNSAPPLPHAKDRKRTGAIAITLFCGLLLSPQKVTAESTSPFASFSGNWRGSGQVMGSNGNLDKIRCRADYSTTSQSLSQSIVCASDSYRFDIRSYIVAEAGGVEGNWEESVRQVKGHLAGRLIDGHFEGRISGLSFTAEVSLNTTGRRQTIVITPQGGDISRVQIVLSRES